MRNNFHYGFGTRLTAVILTLLMVLSLGGFTLRGQGVDEPMIFDESYGTPAPEATELPVETAAPEATEEPAEPTDAPEALPPAPEVTDAPAEDTPVPEATEAPAEATPVPETDSGMDTNMNTSEPETTADPQMAPALEGETTAAPEGDTPADEIRMDGLAPIAVEAAVLKITISGTAPNYTLIAENVGTAADNDWQFEFESEGNYSTPEGNPATVQPKIEDPIEVSGGAVASKSNQKVLVTAFPIGGKVTVHLTAAKAESVTRFGVKIQKFFPVKRRN